MNEESIRALFEAQKKFNKEMSDSMLSIVDGVEKLENRIEELELANVENKEMESLRKEKEQARYDTF